MDRIHAWKTFIKARIAIENGDHRSGLASLEEVSSAFPLDLTFQKAKLVAEQLVDPGSEGGVVAGVEAAYARLADALVGENDQPKAWIAGLENLASQLETPARATLAKNMVIAW